ncbi:MAG: aminotransferase class III-fold pyridoxal phosphate-dependent enzyme [Rhizobiaceae bacterium]|nr:aminotransferase class III-fold pyridoxal phosphate-dependent enzyme [Rhizobiaceae bacterium]
MNQNNSMTRDQELRARALKVVPGGMTGHLNAAALPSGYPQFFESGSGCRIRDVDGREFIDFMCSWGPVILGHHHPEVEEAVARQMALGDCLNGPTERFVELAELFTDRVEHADWALFQKNGTDATTVCLTVARAGTGRRKILVASGAYHGAIPWCSPSLAGVTAEDRAHLIYFAYNDLDALERAVAEAGDDLAGIMVSAFRHDVGFDQQLARKDFAQRVRAICDEKDAALIVDDVRAGLRVAKGCSWETLGVNPDLSAWSKALANGYALAAVAGSDRFRQAATRIYSTGSFWSAGVSMAASIATLKVLGSVDSIGYLQRIGERFRTGIAAQAARYGIGVRQTGPAQMPTILFDDDADYAKGFLFTGEALRRGVYLHPRHNMFFSMAHREADIDEALEATDGAFRVLAEHLEQKRRVG